MATCRRWRDRPQRREAARRGGADRRRATRDRTNGRRTDPRRRAGLDGRCLDHADAHVDLSRRFGAIRFDDVRVPLSSLVGTAGGADDDVWWALDLALVMAAAESVGAMQAAFDMTVEWAFDRYSFGRPLASYQALKHRFADMKTWLEASHAISDAAARGRGRRLAESRRARERGQGLHRRRTAPSSLQDCVQLHGGIGVTFEHDLHLFLRRIVANRAALRHAGRPPSTPRRPRRVEGNRRDQVPVRREARRDHRRRDPAGRVRRGVPGAGRASWIRDNLPRRGADHVACCGRSCPTRRSSPRSPASGPCSACFFDARPGRRSASRASTAARA